MQRCVYYHWYLPPLGVRPKFVQKLDAVMAGYLQFYNNYIRTTLVSRMYSSLSTSYLPHDMPG
jgi:hypothetical protein